MESACQGALPHPEALPRLEPFLIGALPHLEHFLIGALPSLEHFFVWEHFLI